MHDEAAAEAAASRAPTTTLGSARQPPPAEPGQRLRQHRFPLDLWVRLQISETSSSKQPNKGARVAFASVDGNFPEGLHAGRLCELSKAFPAGLQEKRGVGADSRVGADAPCTARDCGRKQLAPEKNWCIGRAGALVIPWVSPGRHTSSQVDWTRGRSLTSLVLAFLQGFEQEVRIDEVTDINLEDADGNVVARAPYTVADVLGSEVSVLASASADFSESARATRQLQWVWITSSSSAGVLSLTTADADTLDSGNYTFGDYLSFGMRIGAAAKTYRYNFRNVTFRSVATTAKNDADVIRASVGSHIIAACDGSCVWDALRGEHKLVQNLIQPQGGSVGYGFLWFEVDRTESQDGHGEGKGTEPSAEVPVDSLRSAGGGVGVAGYDGELSSFANRKALRSRSPSPLGWSGHGLAGGFGDSSEAERLAMLELMRSLAKAIRDGSLTKLFERVVARHRLPKITAFTDSAGLIERLADAWVGLQEDDGIRELSEALNFVAGHARIVLQHVKAHCGTALNEMVDNLAKRGANFGAVGPPPPTSKAGPNTVSKNSLSVLRGGRPKYRKELVPLSQVMNTEEDAQGAELMSNVVFHILEALQEIEEQEQGEGKNVFEEGVMGHREARYGYGGSSSSAVSVESAPSDSPQRTVIPKTVSVRSGSWDWCDGPAWLKSWDTPSQKSPGVSSPGPHASYTATVSPSGGVQVLRGGGGGGGPRLKWSSPAGETSNGPSNDTVISSRKIVRSQVDGVCTVSASAVDEWLWGDERSVGFSSELASQLPIPESRGSTCQDEASQSRSLDAEHNGYDWMRAPHIHVSQLKGPVSCHQDFGRS